MLVGKSFIEMDSKGRCGDVLEKLGNGYYLIEFFNTETWEVLIQELRIFHVREMKHWEFGDSIQAIRQSNERQLPCFKKQRTA